MRQFDFHVIFDDDNNRLTVWDSAHQPVFRCEAHNRATGGDGFGHNARCPRGDFVLGRPVEENHKAFGFWFVPVLDYAEHHEMQEYGRAGIGIHGGGSGLPDSFAPRQGWMVTHGCIRLQNEDEDRLAEWVLNSQRNGGTVYLTVVGR